MRKIILIALMIVMVGCGGMTYEEIEEEAQFCRDNNMSSDIIVNGITGKVKEVRCVPKKDLKVNNPSGCLIDSDADLKGDYHE
jgi:hypothetical protein